MHLHYAEAKKQENVYFSIITATYNASKTIKESVESLKMQSFNDYEHIIIDGASTDNTVTILDDLRDAKTILLSEPDNGMYDALNKGIGLARGSIIGYLHADDIYKSPHVLKKIHDTFKNEHADAVYGDLEYVLKTNPEKILRRWKSSPFNITKLKKGWMPPHPTFFVKKNIYDRYGGFDISYTIAADYELMMRLLGKHKISAVYLPEVLVQMKTGGASNKSVRNIILKSYQDYKTIKQHNIGGINTLFQKNFSKIKQFF
jgi:glycosyltransferase